jgi:IstB-like ATP binding protein
MELAREPGAGAKTESGQAERIGLRGGHRLPGCAWPGQEGNACPGRDSAWVCNHENIFVLGPTGVGKSFIASALAQKACRDGYSALYLRAAALLRELALARADGSLRNFLVRLGRIDVLVTDDWTMAPLNENESATGREE